MKIAKNKTRYQQLLALIKSPAGVIFGISIVLLAVQIISIGRVRPFNSDDLYWQQVVHTWRPFNGNTIFLGTKDIFVEQVPFLALMEAIFSPSRNLVILETLMLTLSAFTFFYGSCLYFFKKLRIKLTYISLLPFVWLASFGFPLVQNYLNSDWRSFEIGLSFLTFSYVAAVLFGDIKPLRSLRSKIATGIVLLLIGLVIYSDPYYVFFTIGPIVLFTAALFSLKKINRAQAGLILGGTAIAFVLGKIIALISSKAGLEIVGDTPSRFIGFDEIVTNIVSSIHGLLIVFGADFFGKPAFNFFTFGAMVNAAILGYIFFKIFGLKRVMKISVANNLSVNQLWTVFFGFLILFVFTLYTLTTLVSVQNYRFFIILIYAAVLFLSLALASTRSQNVRLVLGGLLIAATLFNFGLVNLTKNTKLQPEVAVNVSNAANYDIINAVRAEGLTKGYGSYWNGSINSYLSGSKIAFLPSLCDLSIGTTHRFEWLVDSGQFEKPANRSFYLIDPNFPAPSTCGQEQLMSQFGKPEKVINVLNKTILVYNYDISSKITK